jgi:hypothetical protein
MMMAVARGTQMADLFCLRWDDMDVAQQLGSGSGLTLIWLTASARKSA